MKKFAAFAFLFALTGMQAHAARTDISCVSADRKENIQIAVDMNHAGKVVAVTLVHNNAKAAKVIHQPMMLEEFVRGRRFYFTDANEMNFALEIKDRGDNAYASASGVFTRFPPMAADVEPRKVSVSCAASTF